MMNSESEQKSSKTKKKSSLNKILKTIILILLSIIVIGTLVVLATLFSWLKSAKPLNIEELFNLNLTTYIVDKNDKVIDKVNADENRTMITLDKIPLNLQNAFIAIEDKRFKEHNGIDPYRIIGAVVEDIKTGKLAQGGSTLTQQLVKTVYLSPEKRFKRKIIEMYYSIQLERHLTKNQILEAYLNTIHLGHNIGGVKEASLYYFGKELQDLTLAECAVIAGITQNASLYSPYINFENSMKKKDVILKAMMDQGYISSDEYTNAIKQTIVLTKVQREVETSYFADMVIKDVMQALQSQLGYSQQEAERKLFNGGLKIVSTIDSDIQNIAEEQFKNPKLFPPSAEDKAGNLQPEAAFVIIDHTNGEIKAVMGGRSEKVRRGLNRATQSVRQPGSSIKPLSVYAPALDNGYTVATVVDDAPVTYGNYSPNNSNKTFRGLVTIREGIRSSINVVAVKIVNDLGPSRIVEYLQKFGLTTLETKSNKNDMNLAALSLGGMTKGVKPIEMAAAYGAIANKGIYIKPISFTKVLDKEGNVILENKLQKNIVISPQVSYLMIDIMKGVITGGTGTKAALKNMPVAGKTGTTTEGKDAWFIGYTPYYTAAVWIGHDEPKAMKYFGGDYPAMLWKAVMQDVHANLPYKNFEKPDGLINVSVCSESGKRPTELCTLDPRGSTVISELFVKGTEPASDEICDIHVVKDICTASGLLASPNCPSSLIQSKVFIQRKTPIDPNGKLPSDFVYEAPKEVCTLHDNVIIPPIDPTAPINEDDPVIIPPDNPITPIDEEKNANPDGTAKYQKKN